MKLLRVVASYFKNCRDNFMIDLISKSKRTSEDKEYELHEIDEGLYVYNTVAFVGQNASGKTTAVELLDCCYSILGEFRVENKTYQYDHVTLDIIFYHEGMIYRYFTKLEADASLENKAVFTDQHIFQKKYYKSRSKSVYDERDFKEMEDLGSLPEDTSIVFFVLKKKQTRALYFDSEGKGASTYQLLFKALRNYKISTEVLADIIHIFDENICGLQMVDDNNYKLLYKAEQKIVSDTELVHLLSSGTTKGILLYTMAAASLQMGFDLIIDEIENHFHKTLVENLISFYKDKMVNRNKAALLFTTHYCEVLDLFNRRDNIWISKSKEKVYLENMYENFDIRTELLKSNQFYSNAFDTAVNYEELMNLKRKLME